MKNKIIISSIIILFLSSCTGMGVKRSDKSDEFLVEKKNPLVMPPDIQNLPEPKNQSETKEAENDFKEILKSNTDTDQTTIIESSSSLKQSIIKKIEQ